MAKQLEIINLSTVNDAKRLMGERFTMLVRYFLEDTIIYMEEIEKGMKEREVHTALSPAHTIKSSAKQLGAERISDAAMKIELLCRQMLDSPDQDYHQLEELQKNLRQEFDSALPQLQRFTM